MAGTLIINYLAQGVAASRPVSPSAATGTLSFYFATDTETLSFYDWTDAAWQDVTVGSGTNAISMPQGRLTLTSGTPVLSSSVTGATTVYYALFRGAQVPIWNGSATEMTTITELSQALTDNTKSPAAATTNSNYDLFVWNDGGTKRCTRGPAWSSDTARGTGAGTTEISRNTDGYYTNAVTITNGPGAGLGTYVGTIRTNGSSQVDMIFGGTGVAGGESTNCGVWNCYNRVLTTFINFDNTDSWTYTTLTWRAKNNSTANNITVVTGLAEDSVHLENNCMSKNNGGTDRMFAIGLNSTAAVHAKCKPQRVTSGGTNQYQSGTSTWNGTAPLGFNTFSPIEESVAANTSTWYGDEGGNGITNSLFTMSHYC